MKRTYAALSVVIACVLIAVCIGNSSVHAQSPDAATPIAKPSAAPAGEKSAHVDRWLVLGPFPAPLPAFNTEARDKYGASQILSYEEMPLARMKPADGRAQTMLLGASAAWKSVAADTNGVSLARDPKQPEIAYLAAYVEIPRWTKIGVSVRSNAAFSMTVDGADVVKSDKGAAFKDKKSGEAKLERGKHLILVKAVHMPADTTGDWRLDVSVSGAAAAARSSGRPGCSARRSSRTGSAPHTGSAGSGFGSCRSACPGRSAFPSSAPACS